MRNRLAHRRLRWWHWLGIAVVAAIVAFPVAVALFGLVVGLVAAALGLTIALAFTIGPWAALGYGGYWFWRRSKRKRREQAARAAAQPWQPATTPPPPPAQPAPSSAADPADGVPPDERIQVGRIRRKAGLLLQQSDRFPAGSRQLFVVQRMLDEYLPSTLDAYLGLPSGTAELPITPDRRTGVEVLRGQLDILEAKLDEAATDLRQVNVDRLLANERFLEQHFGRRAPGELTIPAESDTTA